MFFDTHAHANFKSYEGGDEAVKNAVSSNTWLINVGTTLEVSREVVEMAERFPEGVFCAIGLHPGHTYEEVHDRNESLSPIPIQSFDAAGFQNLLSSSKKIVAIGECGLDYYRLKEPGREAAIARQKREFTAQLEFAVEHDLPLALHCREAYEDMLEILKAYPKATGVVHSFTSDWQTARKFLDLGFALGLNGILTFDRTGRLAEVCEKAPLERIVTETDAPYLAPVPMRGKRNEPVYVSYVAEKIAEIKGLDRAQAEQALFENAMRIFRIKPRPGSFARPLK